jgi:excisionase family DNA binding protein
VARKALSPEELAERLGVSLSTVKRWLKSGEVESVKVGRRVLIMETHLVAKFGEEVAKSLLSE